mgnify:CR=1 FL=1
MSNRPKIPATIVTGFLGSGKTTLLRHILNNAEGRRIAVIVNEFGELGIDGDILRGCGIGCDEDGGERRGALFELANGCLCCTVQEEFYPVMRELIARRDDIDHILIETSGLALPKPLVQAFNWPEVKHACTVDAVVTVVDAKWLKDRLKDVARLLLLAIGAPSIEDIVVIPHHQRRDGREGRCDRLRREPLTVRFNVKPLYGAGHRRSGAGRQPFGAWPLVEPVQAGNARPQRVGVDLIAAQQQQVERQASVLPGHALPSDVPVLGSAHLSRDGKAVA